MLHPLLDRDRVKTLAELLSPADDPDPVGPPHLLLDDGRCSKHSLPLRPEHLEQRAVGELPPDPRPDAVVVERDLSRVALARLGRVARDLQAATWRTTVVGFPVWVVST